MDPIDILVWRGDLIESRHRVHAAVVDQNGETVAAAGDPRLVTYWRSSAKPFQAFPFVAAGGVKAFGLTDADVAVMCASHWGEPAHVDQVSHVLGAAGYGEEALQCGAHEPINKDAAADLRARSEKPRAIHCNCSGKHSGMLAHTAMLAADPGTYLHPEHPVQKRILRTVSDFSGVPAEEIARGTDGCGVPVFGLPLANMARAYARLVSAAEHGDEEAAARVIVRAMQTHPHLVAGTGALCTDLMQALAPRIVAKGGAEGVYCVGLTKNGWGVAVKVEDGAGRGTGPAILEILRGLGIAPAEDFEELEKHRRPLIHNHAGTEVGRIEAKLPGSLAHRLERLGREGAGG